MLTDIIKENYNYWELECQKEENGNTEEVASSNSSINKKDTTVEQLNTSSSSLKKEATPSNENITLTLEDTSSLSKKENEENGCEVNKAA